VIRRAEAGVAPGARSAERKGENCGSSSSSPGSAAISKVDPEPSYAARPLLKHGRPDAPLANSSVVGLRTTPVSLQHSDWMLALKPDTTAYLRIYPCEPSISPPTVWNISSARPATSTDSPSDRVSVQCPVSIGPVPICCLVTDRSHDRARSDANELPGRAFFIDPNQGAYRRLEYVMYWFGVLRKASMIGARITLASWCKPAPREGSGTSNRSALASRLAVSLRQK
jgi:hypothetical protein